MSRSHIDAKDRGPRRDPPDHARCPLDGTDSPAVHKRGRPIYRCPECGVEFGRALRTAPQPAQET